MGEGITDYPLPCEKKQKSSRGGTEKSRGGSAETTCEQSRNLTALVARTKPPPPLDVTASGLVERREVPHLNKKKPASSQGTT